MRDRSTDLTTGWISNRYYYDVAPNLARGVAGLGGLGEIVSSLPSAAQRHVMRALDDPEVRDLIRELLRGPNPAYALAEQAEKDVAEYLNPTGQPIVFKEIAETAGEKIKDAQDAIIKTLKDPDSEEATDAREIVRYAEDPQEALQTYYTHIALEAAVPSEGEILIDELEGYDDEDEVLEGIGLGLSSKGKKILKGVAIGAAGIGTVALGVVAGPAAIGAIGSVGSAILGGVKGIFTGAKPKEQRKQEAQDVAEAEYQRAYQAATQRGASDEEALLAAEQQRQLAMQQYQQQQEQYSAGSTPGASASPVDLDWVTKTALELYRIKKGTTTTGILSSQYEEKRREAIEVLVSHGVPRDQAEAYIDDAMSKVAAQDYAMGGAITPATKEEAGQLTISRAGIMGGEGVPAWLLIGGAAIAILSSGGGGDGRGATRRRRRRNPAA